MSRLRNVRGSICGRNAGTACSARGEGIVPEDGELSEGTRFGTLIKNRHGSRGEGLGLPTRSRATSIAGALRKERATKWESRSTPALWVAHFLAFDFVARRSKTAAGILPPHASSETKKLRQRDPWLLFIRVLDNVRSWRFCREAIRKVGVGIQTVGKRSNCRALSVSPMAAVPSSRTLIFSTIQVPFFCSSMPRRRSAWPISF